MEFEKPSEGVHIKKEKVERVVVIEAPLASPSVGDHLYEIRKRPPRDFKALESVVMVLKQERKGRPVSAIAKRNRQKMKNMKKKGINPRVALIHRHRRNLQHSQCVPTWIQIQRNR